MGSFVDRVSSKPKPSKQLARAADHWLRETWNVYGKPHVIEGHTAKALEKLLTVVREVAIGELPLDLENADQKPSGSNKLSNSIVRNGVATNILENAILVAESKKSLFQKYDNKPVMGLTHAANAYTADVHDLMADYVKSLQKERSTQSLG